MPFNPPTNFFTLAWSLSLSERNLVANRSREPSSETSTVRHRVENLLLGLAVQPRPLTAVAARPLKDDPALLVGVHRPLHACHFFDSLEAGGATSPATSLSS